MPRHLISRLSRKLAAVLTLAACLGGAAMLPKGALAETSLSFYLGSNASPASVVNYDFGLGGGPQSATVDWDGETFKMPPYFGVRWSWWSEAKPNWGVAIDNVHAKIAANPMPAGFTTLEFTDGVNMITGNVHYRYLNRTRFTPYAGVGLGFTTPHVEVRNTAGTSDTFRYQFGGPAAQVLFGVESRLNDRWSMFGEVKFAKFWLNVNLDGGGSLSTDVFSQQVAIGITRKFGRR